MSFFLLIAKQKDIIVVAVKNFLSYIQEETMSASSILIKCPVSIATDKTADFADFVAVLKIYEIFRRVSFLGCSPKLNIISFCLKKKLKTYVIAFNPSLISLLSEEIFFSVEPISSRNSSRDIAATFFHRNHGRAPPKSHHVIWPHVQSPF